MYNSNIKESRHDWDKKNLVTLRDRKGHYDEVVCKNCGIRGRRYNFDTVAIPENFKKENAFLCPKAPDFIIPVKVKVIFCTATGGAFKNAIPNSEHLVTTPPEGYKNDHTGVWIMGVDEPIKLLANEFEVIE